MPGKRIPEQRKEDMEQRIDDYRQFGMNKRDATKLARDEVIEEMQAEQEVETSLSEMPVEVIEPASRTHKQRKTAKLIEAATGATQTTLSPFVKPGMNPELVHIAKQPVSPPQPPPCKAIAASAAGPIKQQEPRRARANFAGAAQQSATGSSSQPGKHTTLILEAGVMARLSTPMSWLHALPHETRLESQQQSWAASASQHCTGQGVHTTPQQATQQAAMEAVESAVPDVMTRDIDDVDGDLAEMSLAELGALESALETLVPSSGMCDQLVSQGVDRNIAAHLEHVVGQVERGDLSQVETLPQVHYDSPPNCRCHKRNSSPMFCTGDTSISRCVGSPASADDDPVQDASPLLMRTRYPAEQIADDLLAELLDGATCEEGDTRLDWFEEDYTI